MLHSRISLGSTFQLKLKILIFCDKFREKEYIQKTIPLNPAYWNESRYQISASTNNFDFWNNFSQKE